MLFLVVLIPCQPIDERKARGSRMFCAVKSAGLRLLQYGAGVYDVALFSIFGCRLFSTTRIAGKGENIPPLGFQCSRVPGYSCLQHPTLFHASRGSRLILLGVCLAILCYIDCRCVCLSSLRLHRNFGCIFSKTPV